MRAIRWQEQDDGIVASFNNIKIDSEAIIQQVGTDLMAAVAAAEASKRLTLDFQGVEMVSSALIGKLVITNKIAKAKSIQLKFSNMCAHVHEVLTKFGNGGAGPAQPV